MSLVSSSLWSCYLWSSPLFKGQCRKTKPGCCHEHNHKAVYIFNWQAINACRCQKCNFYRFLLNWSQLQGHFEVGIRDLLASHWVMHMAKQLSHLVWTNALRVCWLITECEKLSCNHHCKVSETKTLPVEVPPLWRQQPLITNHTYDMWRLVLDHAEKISLWLRSIEITFYINLSWSDAIHYRECCPHWGGEKTLNPFWFENPMNVSRFPH